MGFQREGERWIALSTILGTGITSTPRAWLVTPTERFELSRAITTIGRNSDRDIVVVDPQVSRAHAEIRRGQDGYFLCDCRSTNGSRVNGQPVGEIDLTHGDEIQVGALVLRFESESR